ncbi:MAG: HD domain-containing phosphohydrolase [Sporomusaceae bacterium]|nr:HD domain-containing phosphohydrolase [Sporomusaceae bacterium]
MLRLALEYIRPGTVLGKEVFDIDGRALLAAGATLTEKNLEVLRQRGVAYLFVRNPQIELPPVEEVIEESVRLKTVKAVRRVYEDVAKKGVFELPDESRKLVSTIIRDLMADRSVVLHLAHIDRHQNDLFAHSVNVAILSTMTAVSLGQYDSHDLYKVAIGAVFHDIGYSFMPKRAAGASAPSAADAEALKAHTTYGFELLRRVREYPLLAAHIALQHHERADGTGFPRRLKGDGIHPFSRIVALANEYDNLVTGRFNKRGMAAHTAYEQIVAMSTTLFDPEVAEAFLAKIALYPTGAFVRLTNGDIGVVTGVTPRIQHRPRLKIVKNAQGFVGGESVEVDLSRQENLTLFVDAVLNDGEVAALLDAAARAAKAASPGHGIR